MMKKLRILAILIILTFSFSVKAEVLLEVDCNGKDITSEKSVSCEGWLYYETEGIDDIEIKYNTNLDIKFLPVNGFTITDNNGKVIIHANKTLYDDIGFSSQIFEFTLSSNDKCSEKEKVSLNNIIINKKNDIVVSGIEKEFKVTIPKKEIVKSSISTLESIKVDNVNIPNFSKDKLEYKDIKVNNKIIYIDAVRTDDKSSASGLGNDYIPDGETKEHDIVVLAEDGTKTVYKLYITNTTKKETPTPKPSPTIIPETPTPVPNTPSPTPNVKEENKDEVAVGDETIEKSSDNSLQLLEVYSNKKKIDFKFDNKKDKFDITVLDTNKVTIKAKLNDDKASFDNTFKPREVTLDLEDNEVLIKVKAENGDEKTYILNIHVNKKSNDNTLLSLKINDKVINLADEKYEITLPYEDTKTNIEAVANDEKAKVEYEDVELKTGNNDVNITVTAEDGATKEYDVNVVREEEKVLFESIEVSGYNIGFSKDKTSYNLKVEKNVNELQINVVPNNIDFEVLNNKNIHNGSKIIVKATDSNGVYEYTINIEKEDAKLNIICYGVFGIGIISFIASIICVIKKKKSV